MFLSDDVLKIKSVGEQRANKLNNLKIYTVSDLIEYFPRDYIDRSCVKKISELDADAVNTLKARVMPTPQNFFTRNFKITRAKIIDDTGCIDVIWYNQPYLKTSLKINKEYMFTGKVIEKNGKLQLESPDFELINEKELLNTGRIIPVYSSTEKFSQKTFRRLIKNCLEELKEELQDFLPNKVRIENNLCERAFALNNIHFPENDESFLSARRRLVFEELFLLQIRLLQLKSNTKKLKTSIVLNNFHFNAVLEKFGFKMTFAQGKVLEEILADLKSDVVMNRLIQGDVGSGKTAIAVVCAYIFAKNSYQTALMAPTEVLASQHFNYFEKIFSSMGIKCVILLGSQRKKEKNLIYEMIRNGEANIVIGTHAVIQETVEFNNLGLVITDEQHRFGVNQRYKLANKGLNPHVLVMSATPIPRTLALILYGDLDISIIDELPPGRKKIDTIFVNSSYHERVYGFIKKNADEGRQAYMICPTIEENEKQDLKAVINYTEELKINVFKEYNIECIHGKMKNELKQNIMQEFAEGKIQILVATTVIEVGINVPNSTIMLIENAERFGLSQLHQLRGRVGRGTEKSYCILISDSKTKLTRERLKVMTSSSDGFEISGKDLELRGPGEFFGTRQHGLPELKIANLYKDMEILKEAQISVNKLIKEDAFLEKSENSLLSETIERYYKAIDGKISL